VVVLEVNTHLVAQQARVELLEAQVVQQILVQEQVLVATLAAATN
jgi:hypothetical protein